MSTSPAVRPALKVLVLETSGADADRLIAVLKETFPGFQPTLVADEASFVEALSANDHDLILSDSAVPGFSGAQALDLALQRDPDVGFIFVSDPIGEDNVVELLKRGATDFISKTNLARLPMVFDRAVRRRTERQARRSAESRWRAADTAFGRVESRRLALVELGERIRDLDDPGELAYAAAEILGRQLKVHRVGYGVADPVAETVVIQRDWTAPGVASLAGKLHFRDYGSYIDDLRRGVSVTIGDVRLDPRTRETADALIGLSARSFVNMPLTEKGGMVGLLYMTHGQVRDWSTEDTAFMREFGDRIREAIARREAQLELEALAESLARQVEERTYERDRTWLVNQDLLAVANERGYFERVNPSWQRVLGWRDEEMYAAPFSAFVHPDDLAATAQELSRLVQGELTLKFENRYCTSTGAYRWLSWMCVPDRGLIYCSARDITDEKERAAELEAAKEQLRQSQKLEAVGQLTGGLAHDFNNLLGAISGSLDLMRRRNAEGRASDVERYIGVAHGAAKRAAALTHRLLAFARRQTLEPKPINVNRMVADMEDLVRRTIGPQIELEAVSAVGLWPVNADVSQLENALLNLCINARDAMPVGGRLVIETANRWIDERTARDHDLDPGQYVSMCVSDNGVGMTPEVAARAFDPFFTTKPIGMGTGLGLSMIYGFARQSGGQVRIYSEPGEGSMVCIYLPRHTVAEEPGPESVPPGTAPRAGRGETVLVVDDEEALRMLIVEVMEDLGYATLEAGNGAEALRHLRTDGRIDLLVTDVGLPGGMNGRQVADAARFERPDLRVLFITGYAENAVLSHGHLGAGMHVMTKPFDLDAFARRVKDLIESE